MTIEDSNIVDIIALDPDTGEMNLIISDHLEWSDSLQHQSILQDKFNTYLKFFEGGELLEHRPDADGRTVSIFVYFMYAPDPAALQFLKKAKEVLAGAGLGLRYVVGLKKSHLFRSNSDSE